MRITKLQIQNFQKHSKLELDFTQGVNILHGATDAGKSCIVRAIKWVFFNEPTGDIVRKEGTKKTSVSVTLDTGEIVTRIKSKSKNAYHLQVGEEVKKYNSIGRSIPEEVQKVLKIMPIDIDKDSTILNIADQIALPFLLDKSGGYRHKLFNKLSGAEISDKVLQDLNKDVLRVNKEAKREQEEIEVKSKELEALKAKEQEIKAKYESISALFEQISQKQEKYRSFKEYKNRFARNAREREDNSKKIKGIKIPEIDIPKLEKKIEQLSKYKELKRSNESLNKKENSLIENFKQLKIPKIHLADLKIKIEKFLKISEIRKKLIGITKKECQNGSDGRENEYKLSQWISDYKKELKKRNICPTCKQSITDKTVEELKL